MSSLQMTSPLDMTSVAPSVGANGLHLEDLDLLVVEDNDFMRHLLIKILRSLGCTKIRAARNGREAIDYLAVYTTDILLTDWMMSPIDGIELTRYVRASKASPNPFLPIMMITGYSSLYDVLTARDAGVTELLTKPISVQALYGKFRRLILNPRPFVRTASFFGPDRRHREGRGGYSGLERRINGTVWPEQGLGVSARDPRGGQDDRRIAIQ